METVILFMLAAGGAGMALFAAFMLFMLYCATHNREDLVNGLASFTADVITAVVWFPSRCLSAMEGVLFRAAVDLRMLNIRLFIKDGETIKRLEQIKRDYK